MATLLSLLAAAIRKVQQQFYLPPGHTRPATLFLSGAAGVRTCARIANRSTA